MAQRKKKKYMHERTALNNGHPKRIIVTIKFPQNEFGSHKLVYLTGKHRGVGFFICTSFTLYSAISARNLLLELKAFFFFCFNCNRIRNK